jgi:hypothetical protein
VILFLSVISETETQLEIGQAPSKALAIS